MVVTLQKLKKSVLKLSIEKNYFTLLIMMTSSIQRDSVGRKRKCQKKLWHGNRMILKNEHDPVRFSISYLMIHSNESFRTP